MDRRSPPLAAALAAMAVLVLASPDARAETEAAPPESTATITPEPTPAADAEPPQGSLQESTPMSAPAAVAPDPGPVAPAPEVSDPGPHVTPADGAAPPAATSPPPRAVPAEATTDAPPASGSVDSSPAPVGTPRGAPATGDGVPAVAETSPAPALERILPAVERELRKVQADVEAIRRRLDGGAAPPAHDLSRLRSTLERLAPVLLALDLRVDRAGLPGAQARQLLHRVRAGLAETQVATAGLIAALRRSDLHGPELRALLRSLESFGALGSALDLRPGAGPFAPTSFAPTPQPVDPMASAAVLPTPESGASPSRSHAAPPRADDAPKAAGQHAPEPWSSALGSATASAAGAVSVAGLAALAALLIAFALPRLLTRLELTPGRGHMVASVLALERPG